MLSSLARNLTTELRQQKSFDRLRFFLERFEARAGIHPAPPSRPVVDSEASGGEARRQVERRQLNSAVAPWLPPLWISPSSSHLKPSTSKMVNIPKTRRTYCKGKQCRKHTPHKVTQYKAGKASLVAQGKRRYDRKQSGYGGQTKPVFHKKAKTTKKVVIRLECASCKTKSQLTLKRCKHFELGGDKRQKGAALTF
ncbi:hypothetical protein QFC19_006245 [Naganishia cerealis]|uniref:Uncharacterized protein n=1 Tax=Naganishia cerealis TaxID=610337 RepID=A0ACC2VJX2_9TREE|nr:hypothetical protein QFC19_006245 [Naganishia cerealis]